MRKVLALVVALCLAPIGAKAWWQSVAQQSVVSTPTYQGPGDVFATSPFAWYSCARAFTAAYASALGNLCDLVDSAAPTTVICTLKSLSTGKVDLASASCTGGVTPAVKCAAATGGVCNISKAYDQTGNGRDVIQTTAANQPTLVFSSTPSGTLPALSCGAGSALFLASSAAYTQTQPLAGSAVFIRNSGTALAGVIGANVTVIVAGSQSGVNGAIVQAPTVLNATAADNTWHAINGLVNGNGSASAINVDGADTTGAAGTTGFSSNNIRVCRAAGVSLGGLVAEAGIWASATNATDRGNLSTNQHSANGYNF